MEQNDSLEFLDSFKNQTVEDIEFIEDDREALLKITFKNQESFVITGDSINLYFALPKDAEFH
ncbi:MAG: hypothetical protein ACO3UU_04030 [Minisyncoccia bacterium]|jgi:hypothetical protein